MALFAAGVWALNSLVNSFILNSKALSVGKSIPSALACSYISAVVTDSWEVALPDFAPPTSPALPAITITANIDTCKANSSGVVLVESIKKSSTVPLANAVHAPSSKLIIAIMAFVQFAADHDSL